MFLYPFTYDPSIDFSVNFENCDPPLRASQPLPVIYESIFGMFFIKVTLPDQTARIAGHLGPHL